MCGQATCWGLKQCTGFGLFFTQLVTSMQRCQFPLLSSLLVSCSFPIPLRLSGVLSGEIFQVLAFEIDIPDTSIATKQTP